MLMWSGAIFGMSHLDSKTTRGGQNLGFGIISVLIGWVGLTFFSENSSVLDFSFLPPFEVGQIGTLSPLHLFSPPPTVPSPSFDGTGDSGGSGCYSGFRSGDTVAALCGGSTGNGNYDLGWRALRLDGTNRAVKRVALPRCPPCVRVQIRRQG